MEESVGAYGARAHRRNMIEEAPKEFVCGDRHAFRSVFVGAFICYTDSMVGELSDPVFGNGTTLDVEGKVSNDAHGMIVGRLNVSMPWFGAKRVEAAKPVFLVLSGRLNQGALFEEGVA